MVEIEIRGFQSIEHVNLKVEGFTALVGRTNIGKSAIVRAIRAALTNSLGTAFVRHGAACLRRTKGTKTCKCESYVRIKTPDFDLAWRKGDAVNQYQWNGVDKTVPGRGAPDFLAPHFSPVKLGEKSQMLQIADQFFPIFLLDESGGTVANVLSDVARLDAINVAMKHVERDRKEGVTLRKVREKDIVDLEDQLGSYTGLDPTLDKVAAVSAQYGVLLTKQARHSEAVSLHGRLSDLATHLRALDGVDKVALPDLSPVARQARAASMVTGLTARFLDVARAYKSLEGSSRIEVPDHRQLVGTGRAVRNLSRLATAYTERFRVVSELDGVEELSVPSVAPLKERAHNWALVRGLCVGYAEKTAAAWTLAGVDDMSIPTMEPLVVKGSTVKTLSAWIVRLSDLRGWFDTHKSVESVEAPEVGSLPSKAKSLRHLSSLATRHSLATAALDSLERDMTQAETEHTAAQTEMDTFFALARERGWVCDACSQPIQAGHTHQGA